MLRLPAALLAVLLLGTPAFADYAVNNAGDAPVTGSGHTVTQSRPLDEFVDIRCKVPVRLEVSIEPVYIVKVAIDDNLQDHVVTRIEHKTLVIDSDGSWTTANQPRISIAMPELQALELFGSAEASVGELHSDDFSASLVGSGSLEASGSAASLTLSISGSGDARLQDLKTYSATIDINGSGQAVANVSRDLHATINGSGSIRYRGRPSVTQNIHGSGSLSRE